ncbi:hypothetical protein K432DRAFT_91199 [Lepidopterella palustris CBS 459.81]|uniref:Uncharacterized protein n=1 Tax=Lepidopterella palustris CBS 459.81 TaxID=1314670 RepID=A0A8E2JDM1_9PEZI|nr:hypothetical protein K432DRAFT_91199 [Lepidopterella palustris CBS 459.81]
MSSSTTYTSTCNLDKPVDWQAWFLVVQNRAQRAGVWKYVDPSVENPPAPPEQPTYPAPSRINPAAETYYDLNPEEIQRYTVLQNAYRGDVAAYNQIQLPLNSIYDYILSTVSKRNLVYLRGCSTPYSLLRALRKRLAPTDRGRKLELQKKLLELYRPPTTEKQIDTWLQQWETTCQEAKDLQMDKVNDPKPQRYFLAAIAQLAPIHGQYQQQRFEEVVEEADRTSPPGHVTSLYDLIEQFRNWHHVQQATGSLAARNRLSSSAFATFQGEQPPKGETKA